MEKTYFEYLTVYQVPGLNLPSVQEKLEVINDVNNGIRLILTHDFSEWSYHHDFRTALSNVRMVHPNAESNELNRLINERMTEIHASHQKRFAGRGIFLLIIVTGESDFKFTALVGGQDFSVAGIQSNEHGIYDKYRDSISKMLVSVFSEEANIAHIKEIKNQWFSLKKLIKNLFTL